MKTNPWITYRTRFLVKAKQLTTSLAFTDVLGREHSGRKGDYLVEWSDGVLRIAPRKIFEDIYVPLPDAQEKFLLPDAPLPASPQPRSFQKWEVLPYKGNQLRLAAPSIAALLAKKSPQSCHDRRNSRPGISSL